MQREPRAFFFILPSLEKWLGYLKWKLHLVPQWGMGGVLCVCVCGGCLILFKHSYPLKIGAEENTPSIYGFDQRPIHSETTIILGITF